MLLGGGGGVNGTLFAGIVFEAGVAGVVVFGEDPTMRVGWPGGGGWGDVELAEPGSTTGLVSAREGFLKSAYPLYINRSQSVLGFPQLIWNDALEAISQ